MQSIQKYSDKKITYYNSLQSVVENGTVPYTYEELIKKDGAAIDSVLYKMGLYVERSKNENYITEGTEDVLFTIEEQFAARDILINMANRYIESLYADFCRENEIMIDESAKDFLNKVGQAVKSGSDKVVKGFKSLGEKVVKLKQFIKDVMTKAIKTAKELVHKITDLMISIGGTLSQLVSKLGGDEKQSFEFYKSRIDASIKDEKVSKENVYETLSDKLNAGELITEEYVFELFGWGKKKKQEEQAKEEQPKDQAKEGNPKDNETNEYDDAAKAKDGGTTLGGKLKPLADAGLKILLQMMAYYAVTVVLPAIITLIAGPLAGAIVEVLAKLAWSSATIYAQVRDMIKLVKSPEYTQMPKWAKVVRWAMFFVSIGFAAFSAGKAVSDGIEIGKKIVAGAIDQVLPSDAVQKVTEILNNWYKSIVGGNAAGYDKMVAAQNATMTKIIEVAGEGKEASDAAKAKFEQNASSEFDASETNNFDHIRDLGQDELARANEQIANAEGVKSSTEMLKMVSDTQVPTPGTTAVAIDGATLGKIGRADFIKQIAKELGIDPADIDISQISNVGLRDATKKMAGTVYQVIIKGDATQQMADNVNNAVQTVAQNAGMGHGFFHLFSKIADNVGTATKVVEVPVNIFKNSFVPFAGIGPIALKYVKKGGFRMRLGSGRTGNHLYDIEEVKEMPFKEVAGQYESKNPKVFKDMAKIINDNNRLLEDYKKQLDDAKKLSKEDKKKYKLITNQLEKMKEGAQEYELLIFYTKDEFAATDVSKKKEEKQTSEAKDNTLYPVAFFNPMILAGGDLAPRTSTKGPRSHIYFAKGLFSRLEFLPKDGGMSKEDIVNMFTSLMKESLKACYNMAPDVPCKKEDKQYVENPDSQFKGKERPDFGGFTNTQLTEIFNSPDEVTKYLGGKYATDTFNGGLKHEYSERDDEEYLKKHHDKVIKEYIKIINNDEELMNMLKNSETLKAKLLDDEGNLKEDELEKISDNLIRVEQNYLKGEKKKGLFDKIKKWFNKDEEEGKETEIDPTELRDFAFKLASKWKKYRRKMNKLGEDEAKKKEAESSETNESLEEYDIDFTIFDANLEIFENEFVKYFNNELNINESYEDDTADLLV